MRKILLLFTILALTIPIKAQKIGEWTAHTPGVEVISVDIMHKNIFAATPYDVFFYNTNDNSINHLSKVNGLSDMGISMMRYSQPHDIMFVGYTNTNIDIIDNHGDVTNIPDIYHKYILGNKTINNVFFHDKYAYVCCGFGIVVIDLSRKEVKDTYIIGPEGNYLGVNDLTLRDGVFYAATDSGIYYADADNTNLADFSQWHKIRHGLPHTNGCFSHIENFDNYVVTVATDHEYASDSLIIVNDTVSWEYFTTWPQRLVNDLRAYDDFIIMTEKEDRIKVFDKNKNRIYMFEDLQANSAVYDENRNCFWAGTKTNSLTKISPEGEYEFIRFNGPFSAKSFSLSTSGDNLWVAAGGYTGSWHQTWNHNGYYHYDGDRWAHNNMYTDHLFDSVTDITYVKASPVNNNIIYVASFSHGLLVFEGNKFKRLYDYRTPGCSLGKHTQLPYTFVTGLDYDSQNNMWIANNGADRMLSVWKTDGSWQAYNIGPTEIGRLMVDKNDVKWIVRRGGEIAVFYNGTTKTVNKNANTGELPGDANCFVTDRNGTVWVGTTDGVALFYDSKKIFRNNSYACSRILIPRNDGSGQADYLLSGQSVLSIAVDGANNMWFGTTDGVIQTSNDGQTTYHHFTTDNSPLFSNTVKDIAIDADGNVYFSTDFGIVSYKGTATQGQEKNEDVIVYPNPVRPEHSGIVGIKGLVTDALVKITTTNGAFVTHLRAQGGQAVWDCTDINGNKVEPGIYLIFVSDETGKETFATKVLIMK
ncbi:MAG: hypothetical protein J6X10_07535 [Bacteroidales bacterium]|nr:hypothetical protein [Bacteroidales bacterium]